MTDTEQKVRSPVDKYGQSDLHRAAGCGDHATCARLLGLARVDGCNDLTYTRSGSPRSDLYLRDHAGYSCFHHVMLCTGRESDRLRTLAVLLTAVALDQLTAQDGDSSSDRRDILNWTSTKKGKTALHMCRTASLVTMLHASGLPCSMRVQDAQGRTPLLTAAADGHTAVCAHLLYFTSAPKAKPPSLAVRSASTASVSAGEQKTERTTLPQPTTCPSGPAGPSPSASANGSAGASTPASNGPTGSSAPASPSRGRARRKRGNRRRRKKQAAGTADSEVSPGGSGPRTDKPSGAEDPFGWVLKSKEQAVTAPSSRKNQPSTTKSSSGKSSTKPQGGKSSGKNSQASSKAVGACPAQTAGDKPQRGAVLQSEKKAGAAPQSEEDRTSTLQFSDSFYTSGSFAWTAPEGVANRRMRRYCSAVDAAGWTSLMLAAHGSFPQKESHQGAMRTLLAHGADINVFRGAANILGETVFHVCTDTEGLHTLVDYLQKQIDTVKKVESGQIRAAFAASTPQNLRAALWTRDKRGRLPLFPANAQVAKALLGYVGDLSPFGVQQAQAACCKDKDTEECKAPDPCNGTATDGKSCDAQPPSRVWLDRLLYILSADRDGRSVLHVVTDPVKVCVVYDALMEIGRQPGAVGRLARAVLLPFLEAQDDTGKTAVQYAQQCERPRVQEQLESLIQQAWCALYADVMENRPGAAQFCQTWAPAPVIELDLTTFTND